MATQAEQLLDLVAMSGELPNTLLSRLDGGASYQKKLITSLKQDGMISAYSRDGMKGYRLSAAAKRLLLNAAPERYSFFCPVRMTPICCGTRRQGGNACIRWQKCLSTSPMRVRFLAVMKSCRFSSCRFFHQKRMKCFIRPSIYLEKSSGWAWTLSKHAVSV